MKLTNVLAAACGITLGTILTVTVRNRAVANQEKDLLKGTKEIFQKTDSAAYNKTLQFLSDHGVENNRGLWEQALRNTQHKMDVQRAYFEGAQMVRDSIAKANLNDTVKTVIKSVK